MPARSGSCVLFFFALLPTSLRPMLYVALCAFFHGRPAPDGIACLVVIAFAHPTEARTDRPLPHIVDGAGLRGGGRPRPPPACGRAAAAAAAGGAGGGPCGGGAGAWRLGGGGGGGGPRRGAAEAGQAARVAEPLVRGFGVHEVGGQACAPCAAVVYVSSCRSHNQHTPEAAHCAPRPL